MVVNSISTKEGVEQFLYQARVFLDHGAAVIVLVFDEDGQADTRECKTKIRKQAFDILNEALTDVGV